jgi:probable F420-dependent oxidoreductase
VRSFRLGVSLRDPLRSRDAFAAAVQRIEALGFDFVAAADHLGHPAPFAALVAAAAHTERVRLRTYVLNVAFWNPALLAREAASADVLSDGRLELGLGAGHMRSEWEDAGLQWQPAAERIARLRVTAAEVQRRLLDESMRPRPIQRPLPLLVGAMSQGGLSVAAELADIVAFAGLRQMPGRPAGEFTVASPEETDALVALVRERRGERPYESDVLLQQVRVGQDPLAVAAEFCADVPGLEPQELLRSPFVLFAAGAEEAAAELRRRRERWGFSSITTFSDSAEHLAHVIEHLTTG